MVTDPGRTSDSSPDEAPRGRRGGVASGPNRILALLVGVVVVLAGVAGTVVANRSTPTLDLNTPEGTVQAYLQAVVDGDSATAADLLSPSSDCEASDVASAYAPSSARIVLERTTGDADRAVVTVDITEGSGDGPFGGSGYSHSERLAVEREDGVWKITGAPWPLYSCTSAKG